MRRVGNNRPVPARILIITGDAGESFECLYARQRFLEAGLQVHVAAPSVRRLHLVIHDFEPGWDTYVERPGYGAHADVAFDQVDPDAYDAVLVLGGRAPEYLRHDARVLGIVRRFHSTDRWVWAICHGVQVLAAAGVIGGRRVTAYTHCRWDIEAAGATYVAADQAVRDGRIVTGQTWESHPEFYREIFRCLAEGA